MRSKVHPLYALAGLLVALGSLAWLLLAPPATAQPTREPIPITATASTAAISTPTPSPSPALTPTNSSMPSRTTEAIATPQFITPGMGEGAFRTIDVSSVGGPVHYIVYAPGSAPGAAPGDHRFATAGADGTVRIWNATRGDLLQTLTGHEGRVNYLAYAPDGTLLASAGEDGTVHLWEPSGNLVAHLEMPATEAHSNGVQSVAFSPDGAELVATSDGGDVFVWDVAQQKVRLALLGHEAPVYHASFSPNGKLIATGDAAGVVRIWDVASGVVRHTFHFSPSGPEDGRPILSVVFDKASSAVVVGSIAGDTSDTTTDTDGGNAASVRIWELESGEQMGALASHGAWGSRAVISPDGAFILTADHADPAQEGPPPAPDFISVRLWDRSSGALRIALLGYPTSIIAASFRPDGEELLTSDGTTVYLWPAAMLKVLTAAHRDPVAVQVPAMGAPAENRTESGSNSAVLKTVGNTLDGAGDSISDNALDDTSTPTHTPTPTVVPTVAPTRAPLQIKTPTFLPFLADAETFCTVIAQSLNLRSGPGTAYTPPLTLLENGAYLQVTGRNASASWLQVTIIDDETREPEISGWVSANFVSCTGDTGEAPVLEGE